MRKVTVKKVQQRELEYLQQVLNDFIIQKNAALLPLRNKDGYFDAILLMDIAQKVYYSVQGKIQRFYSKTITLSFQPFEAAVLLQCLNDTSIVNTEISNKFITILYTELINLSSTVNPNLLLKHEY